MPYLVLGIVGNNICRVKKSALFNWSPKAIKGKSRDQEQCRAEVAIVEEPVRCYKESAVRSRGQEISPEILLSPALHHDDQDQDDDQDVETT